MEKNEKRYAKLIRQIRPVLVTSKWPRPSTPGSTATTPWRRGQIPAIIGTEEIRKNELDCFHY